MKTRINISIGAKIHAAAKKYAAARDMDFSELLAYLLRRELDNPSTPPIGAPPKSKAAIPPPEKPPTFPSTARATPGGFSLSEETPAPAAVGPDRIPAKPVVTKARRALRGMIEKENPKS